MTTQTKTTRVVALCLYQGHVHTARGVTCANPGGMREVARARVELTQQSGPSGEYTNAAPLKLIVGEPHGTAVEILSFALYPARNADEREPDPALYAASWPADAHILDDEHPLSKDGPHGRLSAGGAEFEIPAHYLVVPAEALAAAE
jgi:hypothetical protein